MQIQDAATAAGEMSAASTMEEEEKEEEAGGTEMWSGNVCISDSSPCPSSRTSASLNQSRNEYERGVVLQLLSR